MNQQQLTQEEFNIKYGHRKRGDVDNQLGNLYDLCKLKIPLYEKLNNNINEKPAGFVFHPFDNKNPNILVSNNVINRKLARKVRHFINSITFDNTQKEVNGTDNQQKDKVSKFLFSFPDTIKTIKFKNDDEDIKNENVKNEWIWEKYSHEFWRLLPTSLQAFLESPIIELIKILEKKWYSTKIPNFDITKYQKATWVIQRIEEGNGIGFHSDTFGTRKLAFVYYLTPTDWDYKIDGGELCVCKNNIYYHFISVNPVFNSMIVWNMEVESPSHFVNSVKSNKQARIALVGFFME